MKRNAPRGGRSRSAPPRPDPFMERRAFLRQLGASAAASVVPGTLRAGGPSEPGWRRGAPFEKRVFGSPAGGRGEFERFAGRARRSGATHVVLTAEDLPWARWQYDTPGDPYPAWVVSNMGLLKVAVPAALRPHLPMVYADEVMGILRERCRVLRELGLRAAVTTFEPQMLPESVFEEHPLWRGPQVDHPLRSRVPRFAPSVDAPEVLGLYRESIRRLLEQCPEIEIISFRTTDSGAGIDWHPGLYPGPQGIPSRAGRSMAERYGGLVSAIQAGARDAGVAGLEVEISSWWRERDPEMMARRLGSGTAIYNLEGPDATPYKAEVGFLLDYFNPYYPVRGIPLAARFLEELEEAQGSAAPRLFLLIGDAFNRDLYFRIYDRFQTSPTRGYLSRLHFLRDLAAESVGPDQAEVLLDLWLALHEAQERSLSLNRGGSVFYLGSVQQRWLTRPFVPFPEELTPEEKAHYQGMLFQARTEERAMRLDETQGSRNFDGRGGMLLGTRILGEVRSAVAAARAAAARLAAAADAAAAHEWRLLDTRLAAFQAVAANSANAIAYQHYLDVIRASDLRRPVERVQGLTGIEEWGQIREVARSELENTARLVQLLESTPEPVLDLAASPAEEDIRVLGPDLVDELRAKMRIMVAHWEDYERLFIAD